MKSLPEGNYALAIAHPGHELRLHGFLEKAKPFVFILTDNSEQRGQDMMWDSIKVIDRATKLGVNITSQAQLKAPFMRKVLKISLFKEMPEGQVLKEEEQRQKEHIKDSMIEYEVVNKHTAFLNLYIDFMVENLIKYKIDYLVCDASEDHHLSHEVMRMICEMAILKVKERTGDIIQLFDFSLSEKYNSIEHEHCICITLDDEAVERKLHAICTYPLGVQELMPNIIMDQKEVDVLRNKKIKLPAADRIRMFCYNILVLLKMRRPFIMPEKQQFVFLKNKLKTINYQFLKNEILRPARQMKQTERFNMYIAPVYGKLLKEHAKA